MGLSMGTAELWVERWEHQQQRYAVDREERFAVVADVVEHATVARDRPLVVDLGCGPGSLAARLAARLPRAEVVAVDMDPLLLELGRTHHDGAARFVDAVIGADGWVRELGLTRPLDAAVSTTALHYLPEDTLLRVYRDLAGLLRPGGVLVNADHLPRADDAPAGLAAHVRRRRAERQGALDTEDWQSWWAAAARDPELADLFAERAARRTDHARDNGLTLCRHTELLREAGFTGVAPVWQFGDHHVLVAVR
ncbi:class I SAM-dependent methyltransferase [Streptomyces capparidis]